MTGPLEVPFGLVHERIEALVGRGVYTHEMAGERMFEMLISETLGVCEPPSLDIIVQKAIDLKGDDRVIVLA